MCELIPEFKHIYSLTPEWRQKFVDELGGIIVGKSMLLSEEVASGSSYFVEIHPDVSVLVIDSVLNKTIRLTRIPTEDDFWIVYFDLSDSFSKHIIENVSHKIGYKSKLGFAIVDNKIKSTYLSTVGERYYSLRLFIRKSYMKTFFTESEFEKDFKDVFDDKKKKMFFYGHIDSRSKVVLYDLKQQDISSSNYELLVKGAANSLLGYLIERLNSKMPSSRNHLEKDIDAVMLSQQHLLSDLSIPFPGIDFLANMANMSSAKYIKIYNYIFGMSPVIFFKNEKLRLAKELLESGDFKLISDVAFELGYNKTAYFSSIYRDYFGVLPKALLK
ncbi:helix-turn-helix transcriptional regulator [Flavobacterium sp. ALJ2]|uniref:helix-turn-helix domain-containing protein n=1 Tax=Flavobacterium sp. ALJ2 TaxID=2786960 RepID=UPI0018A0967C|nr:AraC family transcriptional regulator [Flavobacterium sp. ALJ2]MBF7093485.1 helix-turn-helix transcriptional regulator [Flavobacterium sp. ALJ2]